jgi:uncharacterized membrane protein
MTGTAKFNFPLPETDLERASNGYLMSLMVLMAGLPLPIINLVASIFFYIGNRKTNYFVRWHCLQALLAQVSLFAMNSTGLYWTLSIVFGSRHVSNAYIAYLVTIFLFNAVEFVAFVYAASVVRQGKHVRWFLYGSFADLLCRP